MDEEVPTAAAAGESPGGRSPDEGGLGTTFQRLLEATAVSNLGDGIRLAALPLLATTLTDGTELYIGPHGDFADALGAL